MTTTLEAVKRTRPEQFTDPNEIKEMTELWRSRKELDDAEVIREIANAYNAATHTVYATLERALGQEYRLTRILLKIVRWGGEMPSRLLLTDFHYSIEQAREVIDYGIKQGALREFAKPGRGPTGMRTKTIMLAVKAPKQKSNVPLRGSARVFGSSPLLSTLGNHVRHHVKGGRECNCSDQVIQAYEASKESKASMSHRRMPATNRAERDARWEEVVQQFTARWAKSGYGGVNAIVHNLAEEFTLPGYGIRRHIAPIIAAHKTTPVTNGMILDPMLRQVNETIAHHMVEQAVDKSIEQTRDATSAEIAERMRVQREQVEHAQAERNARREVEQQAILNQRVLPETVETPKGWDKVETAPEKQAAPPSVKRLDDAVAELEQSYTTQYANPQHVLGQADTSLPVFDVDVTCMKPVTVMVPVRFTARIRAADAFATQEVLRGIEGFTRAHSVVEV